MKILFVLLGLLPLSAFAGAACDAHPKSEWVPENKLKQTLVEEGYTIKKFKVDGNCYEIYGRNKEGKKVEIYFDTKTLAIVKAEVER
ncbi:MAG: PepSY domain-containing protein [Methylotenera sp.]|uniref:PepSY domain-containing protein n=1 Tax=Methylotenera sp. TaxID=2051956 RepID=UPI002718759A|nr:PepSY domain-containing protein [Methylotenera sp.]MDO9150037.1 PepSY domain-containing protein [Methylotenera sp.]